LGETDGDYEVRRLRKRVPDGLDDQAQGARLEGRRGSDERARQRLAVALPAVLGTLQRRDGNAVATSTAACRTQSAKQGQRLSRQAGTSVRTTWSTYAAKSAPLGT
jgi:hypothetical protein